MQTVFTHSCIAAIIIDINNNFIVSSDKHLTLVSVDVAGFLKTSVRCQMERQANTCLGGHNRRKMKIYNNFKFKIHLNVLLTLLYIEHYLNLDYYYFPFSCQIKLMLATYQDLLQINKRNCICRLRHKSLDERKERLSKNLNIQHSVYTQ